MPILDPVNLSALLTDYDTTKSKYSKQFFIQYLKIASHYLYRSSQTIEASIQFKKDIKSGFKVLNKLFGCYFSKDDDFDDPNIKDYYRFLYDHIDAKYIDKQFNKQKGVYRVYYGDFKMYFFQPFIDLHDNRSWFLTNSPYAVLVINNQHELSKSLFHLSNFEIDLLTGAGFLIVLCVKLTISEGNYKTLFNEIISNHKFTEIHLYVEFNEDKEIDLVDEFFIELLKIYNYLNGYLYIYSQFILDKKSKSNAAIKQLKQKPRLRFIFTTGSTHDAFKSLQISKTKPFVYCNTGFEEDLLCVNLCNVPLYNTSDYIKDFLATEYSGNSIGYIAKDDFLSFSNNRVKIIFADSKQNDHHLELYINFDDLHNIKSDMYVDETISLAKTNNKTLKTVDLLMEKIRNKDENKKRMKKIFTDLCYACDVYTSYIKLYNSNNHFEIHKNQLLTSIEALQNCFFEGKRKDNGVIYQVETGEGKSCIVLIIAAVLAMNGKTVHIASSNINLSNRDYYNSFELFNQLDLSSAVLLHYNELPYVNLNEASNESLYKKSKFPKKFFKEKLFKNSSNMNFSVCGINSENEITKNKANIIFSTFVNFESL